MPWMLTHAAGAVRGCRTCCTAHLRWRQVQLPSWLQQLSMTQEKDFFSYRMHKGWEWPQHQQLCIVLPLTRVSAKALDVNNPRRQVHITYQHTFQRNPSPLQWFSLPPIRLYLAVSVGFQLRDLHCSWWLGSALGNHQDETRNWGVLVPYQWCSGMTSQCLLMPGKLQKSQS